MSGLGADFGGGLSFVVFLILILLILSLWG